MSPERHSKTSLSAVLLDLDDTLYPERDFVRGGFQAAAALVADASRIRSPLTASSLFNLFWQHFEQGLRGSVFDAVLSQLNIPRDPTLIDELVRAYRSHEPQLTLFLDADRVLKILWPRYGLENWT